VAENNHATTGIALTAAGEGRQGTVAEELIHLDCRMLMLVLAKATLVLF
jgi:hypothetical protein